MIRAALFAFAAVTLTSQTLTSQAWAADPWVARAQRIAHSHKLLSASEMKCVAFLPAVESDERTAAITVVERHGGRCPGDPHTAPRMFDLKIDRKTGATEWDNNDDRAMRPIP